MASVSWGVIHVDAMPVNRESLPTVSPSPHLAIQHQAKYSSILIPLQKKRSSWFQYLIYAVLSGLHLLWCWFVCVCVFSWWSHQMETFSMLLALCVGNSPVTGEFHSQRPVTRSFDFFSLIYAWRNGRVNNRDAGDLRHHHAYDGFIVMYSIRQD